MYLLLAHNKASLYPSQGTQLCPMLHHFYTDLKEQFPITIDFAQLIPAYFVSLSSSSLFKVFAEPLLWAQLRCGT